MGKTKCDWQSTKDEYGLSWDCKGCGKCAFYQDKPPTKCLEGTDAPDLPSWSPPSPERNES